jgi:hypothetical protein
MYQQELCIMNSCQTAHCCAHSCITDMAAVLLPGQPEQLSIAGLRNKLLLCPVRAAK